MNFKCRHFFIIGAQRSGTTYLSEILEMHPEILMAKPQFPEPKYFLNTPEKSLNYKNYLKSFFANKKKENLLGEKSCSYFYDNKIFYKIKKIIDDFKIIIILRSSIENLDIETAIYEEKYRSNKWQNLVETKISSNPFSYVESGKYYKHITEWRKLVGKKKIIIIIGENFFGDLGSIKCLYRKLGVNDNFVPKKYEFKVNEINHTKRIISSKLLLELKREFRTSNEFLKKGLQVSHLPNITLEYISLFSIISPDVLYLIIVSPSSLL